MNKRRRLISVLIVLVAAGAAAWGQQPSQRGVVPAQPQTPAETQQRPAYHALVIGIDNYDKLPKLGTAVSDANSVAKLLHDQYGFEVQMLTDTDASYQKIVSALSNYAHSLQENDNLLIYYAGHGMYVKETDTAYWLPADSEPDDDVYWITANVITTHLHAMRARHVLVVSDSCYSGMLTRSVNPSNQPPDEKYIENMLRGRSRHLMSSGGDEPVADGGAPGHSVFSGAFLRSLSGMNEEVFTATDLFNLVQRRVAGGSEQVPQYMPIRDSGDEEGDFVFFQSQVPANASANGGDQASSGMVTSSAPKTSAAPTQQQPSRPALMARQAPPAIQRPVNAGETARPAPSATASRPAPSMPAAPPPAPNLGGTWIEINPKNPENPRNLVLQQVGQQVRFAGFRLTMNQGVASWSGPQGCASRFQHAGYDYPQSNGAGTVTLKMSLQGSTLVYNNDVNWRVPCDGHGVGEERQTSQFQRTAPETPAQTQAQPPASGFRVTQVTLYPTPGSFAGHCPLAIRYRGVIVASGPGTVRYTFVRSNNATAPVSTLQFDSAGDKEVFNTWQVGGSGRTLELWQALKILDPSPAIESNKAITQLACEAAGARP
jgi:Caspase domain